MNAHATSPSTAVQQAAAGATVGITNLPAEETKRYRVFLSYSHTDTTWARWLMRRLEGYRVPARFHGRAAPIGTVGSRIAPVFRDRDELPTTNDLGETIRTALRESATLVVLCSPTSAKSRWVREEILTFKRMGGGARVFAFIIDGEPKAEGTDHDCFSPALRYELGADGKLSTTPAEVVAADARPEGDGKEDAFVRLIAGLLGVGFDELRQRELQRRYRRLTWIAVGSLAGMAITAGLALYAMKARDDAVLARNDAQRRQEQGEKLVASMLDDLNTRLQKADKLDALDGVGANVMAYFQSLNPRDLTDTTLAQQATALRQIGEMRLAQLRYAEAEIALKSAFERTAALAARHPHDGELLFGRGQAEFGIGNMHRKRGEVAAMGEWFERYRGTCVALVKLDPSRSLWQGELAYGLHNVAVYDLDRGRLDEARQGFLAELEILPKLATGTKVEVELQFRLIDANSWLGTLEERSGHLVEAARRFSQQAADLETVVRSDPENAKWKARLADALALHAGVLAITGQHGAALENRRRVDAIYSALIARDPKNRGWQKIRLHSRLKEARILMADNQVAEAEKISEEALAGSEKLAALEPSDIGVAFNLAVGSRLRAEVLETAGREGADTALARAIELGERIAGEHKATPEIMSETAKAHLASGQLAARHADRAAALAHWKRALELVDSIAPNSSQWPLLDAKVRALTLLGERARAEVVLQQLQRYGFQPLERWPNASLDPNLSVPSQPMPTHD